MGRALNTAVTTLEAPQSPGFESCRSHVPLVRPFANSLIDLASGEHAELLGMKSRACVRLNLYQAGSVCAVGGSRPAEAPDLCRSTSYASSPRRLYSLYYRAPSKTAEARPLKVYKPSTSVGEVFFPHPPHHHPSPPLQSCISPFSSLPSWHPPPSVFWTPR